MLAMRELLTFPDRVNAGCDPVIMRGGVRCQQIKDIGSEDESMLLLHQDHISEVMIQFSVPH